MNPSDIERHFSRDETILEHGSTSRVLYVVRSGEVRLEEGGRDAILLGPGDLFGEVGAILGEPHRHRVVAVGDVTVLALGPKLLNQLCSENADFSMRLIRHLAERLYERPSEPLVRPQTPETRPPPRRLIEAILDRSAMDEVPIRVDARLKDLAGASGLSMLEAYHHVQALLEQRVLRLSEDVLTLVEPEKLNELAR